MTWTMFYVWLFIWLFIVMAVVLVTRLLWIDSQLPRRRQTNRVRPLPLPEPLRMVDQHIEQRRRELATLQGAAAKGWSAHRSDRVVGVIEPKADRKAH